MALNKGVTRSMLPVEGIKHSHDFRRFICAHKSEMRCILGFGSALVTAPQQIGLLCVLDLVFQSLKETISKKEASESLNQSYRLQLGRSSA